MASPRVPGGRRASTCSGGGSKQLQVAPARAPPGGVGSGAGPEKGGGCAPGADWAAPRRSDPGAGCCLGGALRPRPSARALPAPGPARPRPRPGLVLSRPGGSGPGGARPEDRYGDAGALPGRGRIGPAPRGAGPGQWGRERRGCGPRAAASSGGGGAALGVPGKPKDPQPQPGRNEPRIPPSRWPNRLDPRGEKDGCGGTTEGAGARVPQRGPQRLLGAGYTFTAKFRRLKRFTPDHTSLDFQTQRFGCHLV